MILMVMSAANRLMQQHKSNPVLIVILNIDFIVFWFGCDLYVPAKNRDLCGVFTSPYFADKVRC